MIDLSIIIVSYNTRTLTLNCLQSIYDQTNDVNFEVIVIDNASNDGSVDAIGAIFPQVQILRSTENMGFARANNFASKYAKGRYLLLLNPDTVVLDGAIQELYTFAQAQPGAGIYGGRTLFPDGSLNPASCWRRQTPWSVFCYSTGLTPLFRRNRFFDPESYGPWQRDTVREVDIVSGSFFLIEGSLWEQLGGFDPIFFMYGEDADLCLRARKMSATPIISPEAKITHYGSGSEKVRADKLVRLFRAKCQLIQKHWQPVWVHFGIRMFLFGVTVRALVCQGLAHMGIKKVQDSGTEWREVLARRSEWLLRR